MLEAAVVESVEESVAGNIVAGMQVAQALADNEAGEDEDEDGNSGDEGAALGHRRGRSSNSTAPRKRWG